MAMHDRPRGVRAGLSLIELVLVMAIIATIVGFAAIQGRAMIQRANERSAVNTFQQAVWQGATAAAARGFRTELVRSGNELLVRRASDSSVIRRYEFASGVTLNLPTNPILIFTPPGRVDTLPATPIQITADGVTHTLQISLIGEVRVQ